MDTMERYGPGRVGQRLAPHAFEHDQTVPGRFCTCGLPWRNSVHLTSHRPDTHRRRP